MNKTEMEEQEAGLQASKKGSKLSDYEDSSQKVGAVTKKSDLQAIEEYKSSPNR